MSFRSLDFRASLAALICRAGTAAARRRPPLGAPTEGHRPLQGMLVSLR